MARRSGASVHAPFTVGDRVVSNYRVHPFLSDEVLTVAEARNYGTKARPRWRVLCRSPRGVEGWLDGDTLTPSEHEDELVAPNAPREEGRHGPVSIYALGRRTAGTKTPTQLDREIEEFVRQHPEGAWSPSARRKP